MIRCIFKQKGVYNDKSYYKVGFLQEVHSSGVDGEIPYQISVIKSGSVSRTYSISCTREIFDYIQVGEEYDENSLSYNRYGKIVSVCD